MSGAGIAIIVLLALVLCVIGWFISVSNNINRVKLKIEESLSGVEIQLRQRYDVLMQGKTIAEQYAQHEQKVFEDIRKLSQIPMHASISQQTHIYRLINQTKHLNQHHLYHLA